MIRFALSLALSLAFASPAIAAPLTVKSMLAKPSRPTIAELERLRAENPAEFAQLLARGKGGRDVVDKRGLRRMADAIVQLELISPGADIYALGRDVFAASDFMDAFYRSQGQPTRVRRLDASGTSFPHYRNAGPKEWAEDRQIHVDYLKSNGLDLEKLESREHNYLFFDVTSWGATSQSQQLVRSVYTTWMKVMKRDPAELYRHFSFAAIPMGGGVTFTETLDLEAYHERTIRELTTDGPRRPLDTSIPSSMTYNGFWHGDFETFERDAKTGEVTTAIPHSSRFDRERPGILESFAVWMEQASSPEFLEEVREAARAYGFEFSSTRSASLTRIAKVPRTPLVEPRTSWSSGFSSRSSVSLAGSSFRKSKKEMRRERREARRLRDTPSALWLTDLARSLALDMDDVGDDVDVVEVMEKPEAEETATTLANELEFFTLGVTRNMRGNRNNYVAAADALKDLAGMNARASVSKIAVAKALDLIVSLTNMKNKGLERELRTVHRLFPEFESLVSSAVARGTRGVTCKKIVRQGS